MTKLPFVTALLVILTSIMATASAQTHKSLPITPVSWVEVDLTYYHDFPGSQVKYYPLPHDCTLVTADSSIPFVRCTEHISLLRPNQVVTLWQGQQKQLGYVRFSLPEAGIPLTYAHIAAVRPVTRISLAHNRMQPVTGVFIRHALDVRQYTQSRTPPQESRVNFMPRPATVFM